MRGAILFALMGVGHGCWIGSKEGTLEKIRARLAEEHLTQVDRAYLDALCARMPAPVCWAVNKIGIDAAFEDCDADKDGTITLDEMRDADTCLVSCTKLAVLNAVL
tara:strand:- start:4076 stop:4393 length:318 start_codon:yes stop_codon:yes gene_type:complete